MVNMLMKNKQFLKMADHLLVYHKSNSNNNISGAIVDISCCIKYKTNIN